jgi:hypothetical protein
LIRVFVFVGICVSEDSAAAPLQKTADDVRAHHVVSRAGCSRMTGNRKYSGATIRAPLIARSRPARNCADFVELARRLQKSHPIRG